MALSLKDLGTTALTAASFGVVYAQAKGLDFPLVTSARWSSAALLALGIGSCILGGDIAVAKTPWGSTMAALGGAVAIAAIVGMTIGSQAAVMTAGVVIGVMWAVTTVRHAIA